jgi:hypothetical protein
MKMATSVGDRGTGLIIYTPGELVQPAATPKARNPRWIVKRRPVKTFGHSAKPMVSLSFAYGRIVALIPPMALILTQA